MIAGSNIDDVRARLMALENAEIFDAMAWSQVLADLAAAGRLSALADAERRMETARGNQSLIGIDAATGQDSTVISLRKNGKMELVVNALITKAVSVETEYNADGRLKAYWVQRQDDEWGMWIHAASAGKAKGIYQQQDPSLEGADFTDLRATRPHRGAETLLDVTPFTDDTLRIAGYMTHYDATAELPDAFLEFCPCSMCKAERLKPDYRVANMAKVEA